MKIIKKLLPLLGLLYFGASILGAQRGVPYESTTTNVTIIAHQGFHSITNHAATASLIAGYDANKKLVSFTAAATRSLLSVPVFQLTDPGSENLFPMWDDSDNRIEFVSAATFLAAIGGGSGGSGSGDVVGPASATDNAIVVFDSTTGKLVKVGNTSTKVSPVDGFLEAPGFRGTGATADSMIALPDDDGSHFYSEQAHNTTTTSIHETKPAAPAAGVYAWGTPSGTNVQAEIIPTTGTGNVVRDTSPTIASPTITGTPIHPDNSIALGTKTTGNYVSQVAGTANEITVTHTPGEGSTPTLSIHADIARDTEVVATQTGSHTTPSTTNPLAPTWSGPSHMVWYGATGEIDLPAASGYTGKVIGIYNTGAFTITIDPNGTEVIVREGTVQTGGISMTLSSGAGNFVWLYCDGVRWVTLGKNGTLAAGS